MSTVAEKTYTPEDLLAMPDRKKYELVDGHLVERHMSRLSSWVAGRLYRVRRHLRATSTSSAGLGRRTKATFASPIPPARCGSPMSRSSARSACRRASRPRATSTSLPTSRSRSSHPTTWPTRSRTRSSNTLTLGVALVWVINPEARTVHIHRGDGSIGWLREDDELSGEDVVPGFRCRVAAIFPAKPASQTGNGMRQRLDQTRMVAMCGIVGYTGGHQAAPILVAGLRRLEYRGYDSAGLATIDRSQLIVRKRAGRVRVLEELLDREPAPGICGISHTRWATHGPATDRNAHPHLGGRAGAVTVALVHNGVIENHAALRRELESQGFVFASQTDTEVDRPPDRPRAGDRRTTCSRPCSAPCRGSKGTYGLAVVSPKRPGEVDRGPVRQPAGRRAGRGRAPAGQRPGGDRAPHGAGRVLARRRGRPPDGPRLRDPPPRARADHAADRPDRLEARRGRAGRPRPLHDQGDSRAARDGHRRLPRPAPPRRGDGPVRRSEPLGPPAPPRAAGRPRRVRHELARGPGGRVPDRAARSSARRGRIRQRVPLSQRTARRSDAGLRAQPVGRDGRHAGRACARRSGAGTRPWRSSTPSAARSPARPTAGSISTPVPRSASPAPRRSRPR